MCPDTKALLAYVKLELFLADICYYIKINPKPITAMAKKIAEQLIDTLVKSGVERIYAVTGDSLNEAIKMVKRKITDLDAMKKQERMPLLQKHN